jgi:hypothetical protein
LWEWSKGSCGVGRDKDDIDACVIETTRASTTFNRELKRSKAVDLFAAKTAISGICGFVDLPLETDFLFSFLSKSPRHSCSPSGARWWVMTYRSFRSGWNPSLLLLMWQIVPAWSDLRVDNYQQSEDELILGCFRKNRLLFPFLPRLEAQPFFVRQMNESFDDEDLYWTWYFCPW